MHQNYCRYFIIYSCAYYHSFQNFCLPVGVKDLEKYNQYSDYLTGWTPKESFSLQMGQEDFLFFKVSRIAVWLNKRPAHWVLGAVFWGGGMGCT